MDLQSAISRHAEWKLKFRSAMGKQETVDAETISKDNACELGKWLHGDAKAKLGRLTSYATCVARHAAFHAEAGKVARTINAKRFQAAEAMLGAGTAYDAASNAVAVAIIAVKKEAGL